MWSSALDWVGNRRCSAHGGDLASGKKGENVAAMRREGTRRAIARHCEEPTGPAVGGADDKLRDEAIHSPRGCGGAYGLLTSRTGFQAGQPRGGVYTDLGLPAKGLPPDRIG